MKHDIPFDYCWLYSYILLQITESLPDQKVASNKFILPGAEQT
tara:strand:+ start:3999 stop:4127 length:129 start_codon:yes stop_codon:yes gene_type:complete